MGFFIEPRKEHEDAQMWVWGTLIFQPVIVMGYQGHAADAVTAGISLGIAIGACIAVIRRYRHAAGAWVWLFLYGAMIAPAAARTADGWF